MKYIQSLLFLLITLILSGCVGSYKDVKPNYVPNSKYEEYLKDVRLDSYQNIGFGMSNTFTIDSKMVPYGENYVLGKLNSNKKVYLKYVSRITTSKGSAITTSSSYVPRDFKNTIKIGIPVYIVGSNVFDLNEKKQLAFISDKKTVKVVTKLDYNALKRISKNKRYDGKYIKTIKFKRAIKQISFQPNSNRLIAVLDNDSIEIWDYNKKRKVKNLGRHKSKINFIKASLDGKYLITSSSKKTYLWDLKRYKYSTLLNNKKLLSGDISKDSKKIAFSDSKGNILIYDLKKKKEIKVFAHNHIGNVYALSFSPKNSETLLTGGQDGLMKTWDLNDSSYQMITTYNKFMKKRICNAEFLKNKYFSVKSDSLKSFETKYKPKITQCNVLGDKEQIINFINRGIFEKYRMALIDSLLKKYSVIKDDLLNAEMKLQTDTKLYQYFREFVIRNGQKKTKEEMASLWNHKTKTVLTGTITREQYRTFLKTPKAKKELKKLYDRYIKIYTELLLHMNGGAIYGIASSGNKIYSYGSGFQEKYSYYEDKPRERGEYDINISGFDFSHYLHDKMYTIHEKDIFKTGYSNYDEIIGIENSKIIAVKDNIIEIWDYKNKKLVSNIAENGVIYSLAYDKRNKIVAVGLSNHKIKLWDIKNKRSLGEFVGHTGNVMSLAFAKKGNLLISGSTDETVLIWDVKKQKVIKKLTGFERAAVKIKVNSKETLLSIISHGQIDSDILFYDLKNYKLKKRISPLMSNIKDTAFIKNGKEFIAISSGNYGRGESHIIVSLNMKNFKIETRRSHNPGFRYTRGMGIDEKNDRLYIIGSDDEVSQFKLKGTSSLPSFYNMGYDDRKGASISAVGMTKENKLITGNKKGYLSVYK